ncbi:YbaB/EbfC family nucleoid-associated protein [Nocardioides sp. NPDC126508]
MSYEADARIARIEADIAAAQERAAKAREFRSQVDSMVGTAEVDGVTASVDITGVVKDLRLPRQLEYRDPDRLAQSILAAIRVGHGKAAEQAKSVAETTFGAGSDTVRAFSEELDTRFTPGGGDAGGRK